LKTSEIAERCLTDKNTTHSYCEHFYDIEFAKYQDDPISLLEIGVQYGGSIRLWEQYFPKAKIVGIDNDLKKWAGPDQDLNFSDRVQIIEANAYIPETASNLGLFDIIIDDGPHTFESQSKCLELYCSHLKPGGILVIEDVQWKEWSLPLTIATPIGLKTEFVDLIKVKGRYDDLLFVVRNPC
jgi:precorrin-6B methylase 2